MTCHVEIVGQGKPLVLIHGWGMHGGVWQPLVKRLSKQYMLYIVDLPGMGHSRPVEPYHLYNLVEAIAEVIPGVSDVLGWSLGGLVAQHLATIQPDRIRRLILVGTTPCFVEKPDWPSGIRADYFSDFSHSMDVDYKNTIIKFLILQCMKTKGARDTIKQLRNSFNAKPAPAHKTLKSALHILLEADLRDDITNVRKPTLLIHGDRDTLAPVQAAHWMMQNLPKGFLRVISGAAHAPFLSHSEQFIDAL
ncbi:MAG TPA: pimeloyl-ACP methyl ester esterase BioH, partial [Methylophilaceae bacterium]|nr:pimeloyl-ACP methyl ester esterase BioH [Methylophilaceae bacterium]